jgi:hypothetical protein
MFDILSVHGNGSSIFFYVKLVLQKEQYQQ